MVKVKYCIEVTSALLRLMGRVADYGCEKICDFLERHQGLCVAMAIICYLIAGIMEARI